MPMKAAIEVIASVDELRAKIPQQLYDMVIPSTKQPAVEDLDI